MFGKRSSKKRNPSKFLTMELITKVIRAVLVAAPFVLACAAVVYMVMHRVWGRREASCMRAFIYTGYCFLSCWLALVLLYQLKLIPSFLDAAVPDTPKEPPTLLSTWVTDPVSDWLDTDVGKVVLVVALGTLALAMVGISRRPSARRTSVESFDSRDVIVRGTSDMTRTSQREIRNSPSRYSTMALAGSSSTSPLGGTSGSYQPSATASGPKRRHKDTDDVDVIVQDNT
jgi:hypothetical protein